MKTVELTLPELQVWLTKKMGLNAQKVMSVLLSVDSYSGRRWKTVPEFWCDCGGRMFSQYRDGVHRVQIVHTESCVLSEPAERNLYAVFYSTNVNGIWSPWAYEAIVPFSDLHNYVDGERVKHTTYPLPAVKQEVMLTAI